MIASLYNPAKYDGTSASLISAISPDGRPETGVKYRISPCCGVALKRHAGQQLQIENTYGMQVCGLWAYLAPDMDQFLPMSHCRTWLQSVFPNISDQPVTNFRQPVLEDLIAVMSACPQDKNPINGADAKPSELHFFIEA